VLKEGCLEAHMLEMAVRLRQANPGLEAAIAAKIVNTVAADVCGPRPPKLWPGDVKEGVKELFGFAWEASEDNVDAVIERMARVPSHSAAAVEAADAATAAAAAGSGKMISALFNHLLLVIHPILTFFVHFILPRAL
jgi:hypothetical protein